jgi:hypothetical protein
MHASGWPAWKDEEDKEVLMAANTVRTIRCVRPIISGAITVMG